ncbi:hypothetical protein EDI_093610 [Entamoeba dispar SAW760]|uniref:TLDc domain-containing protein n=1 Tax=Entamoeba dispar (strain ATCC PRA-260 / SAW760) TaxID=370354 RepID=B0EDF3_ENTDS|nr:uncharacterized protein EDI_093610 [Entamoeba dispar SAW760]EDR27570.1 hypothetical protein EDI_093610 [Entamoeba dispar SAW760]|eukprot:EDR27570.1 hypothetical protein EDI_093610 [Entamoeba dispar SAW760]
MEVIDNALSTIKDDDIITGKQLKQIITPISIVLSTLSIRVSVIDHLPVFAGSGINTKKRNEMKSPLLSALHTLSELEDDKVLLKLKGWVHGNKAMVIYDSEYDEWNSNIFNKRIISKGNVSLLVFTEDKDIFGIHYKIPKVNVESSLVDQSHFIFSIERHGKPTNKMWKSTQEISCLTLFESGSFLFKTPAFSIQAVRGRKGSYVQTQLSQFYSMLKESKLTYIPYPSFFEVTRIVGIEWV